MKISVIVPCYNVAEWLPECLDSILGQTYTELEVIVIDDGSTDKTAEIIDSYAAKDKRIIAVHQKNEGLVAVREKGIGMATGDYIGFVDGDDGIAPDMYERLLSNALEYGADISHCGIDFVWPGGKTEHRYGTGKIIEQDNFSGIRDLLLGEQIEPSLCNKLYSKRIIKESCPETSVLNNEDLLRNFVLFERSRKSVYEDFCGYRYYQRAGSMSKDTSGAVSIFRHIERARKYIADNCSEEVYPYAMRLWLSAFVTRINLCCESKELEIKELCTECRKRLGNEKKNLHYLSKRQRIAAMLIIYVPALYRVIYKIYSSRR